MSSPREAVALHQAAQQMHRRVGGDVAGELLQAQGFDLPRFAEVGGQQRGIALVAHRLQEAELAVEHGVRPIEPAAGELRRQHAAFAGAAHVQALDHAAAAGTAEGEQAAAQRAGDAERVGEPLRREAEQSAAGDCRPERAVEPGRMESAFLRRVQGGGADAEHDLATRDDRFQQLAPRAAEGMRHRERRQRHGRAGMHAGARLAQAVELEGMGAGAPHQRRFAHGAGTLGARDRQEAGLGIEAGLLQRDARPGKTTAIDRAADGIDQAVGGALDDGRRQGLVAQRSGKLRERRRRCWTIPCLTVAHVGSPQDFFDRLSSRSSAGR